jgi:hypothetical protein
MVVRSATWVVLALSLVLAGVAAVTGAPAAGSTGAAAPPMPAPLSGAGPADTGLVTLRLPADADATVDSSRPDTPLGATRALTIGYALGPDRASTRILLHFPLPTLPPGSTIVSATLQLDTIAVQGQAEVMVLMSPITMPWQEADVTWSTQPPAPPAARWVGFAGPDRGTWALDMLWVLQYWADTGQQQPNGVALWVDDSECDAGRTRGYASREALPGGGTAPTLVLTYVGPGTPHPFPSATPTVTPTSTPTPTGTLPPTPTATTTSTFGQWQGQARAIRPSDGIRLPQPTGGEAWVFEWYPPARGPCQYTGAELTLVAPDGSTIKRSAPGTCYRFTSDHPLPAGRWQWSVWATCAHGPTTPSDTYWFVVDEAPATPTVTAPAPHTPTPTVPPMATEAPVLLPYAGRAGAAGG